MRYVNVNWAAGRDTERMLPRTVPMRSQTHPERDPPLQRVPWRRLPDRPSDTRDIRYVAFRAFCLLSCLERGLHFLDEIRTPLGAG